MAKKVFSVVVAFLIVLSMGGAVDVTRAEIAAGDLSGTYDFLWFGPGDIGMEIDRDEIVFDGAGGWEIEGADSGTYSITDGRFVEVTGSEGRPLTEYGAISPDATIMGLPETGVGDNPGYTILVKRDQSISAADLAGNRYNYVDFFVYEDEENPVASGGYIQFNDDEETLTPYEEYSSNNIVDGEGENISFSVENGYISVEGGFAEGVIGPNGNFIFLAVNFVDEQEENEQGIIILSKSSNAGNGALYGWYNLTSWWVTSQSTVEVSSGERLFIDGNGGWNMPSGEAGIYDISSQGRLELELTKPESQPITSFGAVSPDGSFLIAPEVDEGNLGISMAVKIPPPAVTVTSTATIEAQESETKSAIQLKEEYQGVFDDFEPFSEVVKFTATVAEDLNEFTFETNDLIGSVSNLVLLKLKDSDNSIEFFYASEEEASSTDSYVDGTWWLTGEGAYLDTSQILDPGTYTVVHFVIQDDGDFDLNNTDANTIEDPAVLGSSVQAADDDGGDSGSSSSSGCFINSLER